MTFHFREYISIGVAFAEEAQCRVEFPGACHHDLGDVGAQAGGPAAFAHGLVAQQERRVVAPQGLGPHKDCVALPAQAQHCRPVLGRRDHEPLGPVVVQIAVGRCRGGECHSHRFSVKRVISGRAPNRIG